MAYARTDSETSGWKSVKRFALVTSILTSIAVLGRYTLDCSAMFFGANKSGYEQPHQTPFSSKGKFYPADLGNSNTMMQSGKQSDGNEYGDNLKDYGSLFDFSREKTLAERVYNTFQYGRDAIDALANVGNNDSKSGLEKKVQSNNPSEITSPQQQLQQPKDMKTTASGYSI
ncbi:hypothetical protein HY636_03915 [Candidatus Woesearchaeota archaeon]|nr:hypothetical protein [Candidatus Woesearchaeota archaeon]